MNGFMDYIHKRYKHLGGGGGGGVEKFVIHRFNGTTGTEFLLFTSMLIFIRQHTHCLGYDIWPNAQKYALHNHYYQIRATDIMWQWASYMYSL